MIWETTNALGQYVILKGATTAPKGYKWYWNRKPMFNNGGFHAILVKEGLEWTNV